MNSSLIPRPVGHRDATAALLLGLLVAAVLVSNGVWLLLDRSPSDMDQGRYMLMVKEFADGMSAADAEFFTSLAVGNHPTHPHLVPLLAAVPFQTLSHSQDAAFFVNSLFYAGVIVLVFLLGKRAMGHPAALLAAVLAAGAPLVARFSRFFLLEEAAAFFVVLVIYCLVRTDGFTATRWSIALGMATGLGLLTKWTTVVFVGPPILLVAIVALYRGHARSKLWRIGSAAGASLLVASPWYVGHWRSLLQFVLYSEQGGVYAGDGPGLSQLLFYLGAFWQSSGGVFALLALAGLVFLVLRPTVERLAILSSILVPLLVFSLLVATRDVRHLLPCLPLVSLVSSFALCSVRPPRLRRAAIAGVAALALLSTYQSAWGVLGETGPLALGHRTALVLPAARPPDVESWGFDALLAAARDDHRHHGTADAPARMIVVAGNLPFRPNGFAFLAAERFPSLRIGLMPFFIPEGRPQHRHLRVERLLKSRYLAVREGDINGNGNDRFEYSKAMQRYIRWAQNRGGGILRTIHVDRLPNGVIARIFRIEGGTCDRDLFDFLDWAHETDSDDPGLSAVASGCVQRQGPTGAAPWSRQLDLLHAPAADLPGAHEEELRELFVRHPELRWPRRLLADALRDMGELRAAARLYGDLGAETPYSCSPHAWAGACFKELGLLDPAREALLRGVRDTPDCVAGHRDLAWVLQALDHGREAAVEERIATLLELKEQVGAGRDTAQVRVSLGDVTLQTGRLDEARYHYLQGLRNDPFDQQVRRRLDDVGGPEG